jgi:hypothetical protein
MSGLPRRATLTCLLIVGMMLCASGAMGIPDYYEAMKTYISQYTSICTNNKGQDRAYKLAYLKQKYDHLVYKMTADGRDMLSRFGRSTEKCADGDSGACSDSQELARTLLTLVDDIPKALPSKPNP